MEKELLTKLADKSLTKEALFQKVKQNFSLLPILLSGVSSQKPAVRYGCAKVLMDLSEEHPEVLYPYVDSFTELLDSKYRILTWNAMAIIANLTKVDRDKKFDLIFDKYFGFLGNEYMVTVANAVGNAGKIALAKPYLVNKITEELLRVENIQLTEHLTEECRRVIAEHAIRSFDLFFSKIEDEKKKRKVLQFVERQLNSSRKSLRSEAAAFLSKWRF